MKNTQPESENIRADAEQGNAAADKEFDDSIPF